MIHVSLSNGNNESGSEIVNYSYESGFESNNSSEMSVYEQLLEDCEARSSSSHECFLNSQSRITGEFCNTCRPTCLSKQASINFYQFTAGILLLSTAAPLGYVFTLAIASEITSVETQGIILNLLVGTGAFAVAVSPIWFVESYELTGRHTYIVMAVTASSEFVLFIGLIILYKELIPISHDIDVVNATSKLPVLENDNNTSDAQPAEFQDIWIETPL